MKLAACQRFDPRSAPTGWAIEPIKKRVSLEYGASLTEETRRPGDVPVFGSNGPIGTHAAFLVDGPGILVGRKGSVGQIHFSDSPFWPIDTVYYVRRLGDDDWNYLYYLLGYLNLDLLNAATGVPGLTRRDAHDIFGAFPDIAEQRRIAAALRVADDAIRAAQGELEATKELKRSLMNTLFVRGVPGRHRDFQKTKIGPIPQDWSVRTVRSVLTEKPDSGTSPLSRPDPPGTPILNVSCVKEGVCNPADVTYVDVSAAEIERYRACQGDFFVLRGNGNRDYVATGGLLRQSPEVDTIYSDKLIRLRFDADEVADRFVPYLWQSRVFLTRLQSKAESGSGLWMMSKRDICLERFACPPLEEQKEIVNLLDCTEGLLNAQSARVDALVDLMRSLLKDLLTGKARIPEGAIHA